MRPVESIWSVFGRQFLRYRAPGLTRLGEIGPGWFAMMTGVPDVELNVTALYPPADTEAAAALVERIDRVGEHALVFVSSATDRAVEPELARGGFTPTVTPEPLMWRPASKPADPVPSSFRIGRVLDESDLEALAHLLHVSITMPPEVSREQFALDRLTEEGLGTWLAWDGDEPISSVTMTWDDRESAVWEMMTSPDHRRRGAGRAVLAAALADVVEPSMDGCVLVSTPLGRSLYESLGFAAVDESITWTRGASAEDLARVGQIVRPVGG